MTTPMRRSGVAKTASDEEIRKAYKKIAKTSHPDLNPGDATAAERFKAASAAHDLLKDPEKRAAVRRAARSTPAARSGRSGGSTASMPRGRRPPTIPAAASTTSATIPTSSPTSSAAGRAAARGAEGMRMRGPDAHYTLSVGFLEAARGATRRITMPDGSVLDVKIPQGLADGQTIRLRGKGGPGSAGARPATRW